MLLLLTTLSAATEVVSLGAIVPFIGILTQPEIVFEHELMRSLNKYFQFNSAKELFLPLTLLFAIAAVCAGGLRLLLLWVSIRLANVTGADLSVEVYKRTLYQPYSTHVSRNSSEVISGITQKVSIVTGVLISLVTVFTSLFLFTAILATLIYIEPVVATVTLFCFGFCYGVVAWLTRGRLTRNSAQISLQQNFVVKALQEGLGAIRDVLLDNTQEIYCDNYKRAVYKLQMSAGENKFISQGPRFLMESIGMVIIALLAYMLSFQPGGVSAALPVLGAMALGAQRILPLLQQLYGNWSVVTGSKSAISDVMHLLDQEMPEYTRMASDQKFNLEREIKFQNIGFRYTDNLPWILKNIDITIDAGSKIGIIGETGSGKSTLLDLLMQLLEPTEGEIQIDGTTLDFKRRNAWHRNIAHVPQSIFLSDATIAENIAFGIPKAEIDKQRLHNVAEYSQLLDLISERKNGFETMVGERGVQLSGGQRQRIGIARALYKQASILVLDEATSALDYKTEAQIIDAIQQLDSSLTVFMVAHRITTLENCDRVIELENGGIKSFKSYEDTVGHMPGRLESKVG